MKTSEDFPPLAPSTFYVLASLISGPKHGYAILKDVEERSDGEVRMAIGNFYVALKRLLEQGLIEREGEGSEPMGERRKVYRITGLGEAAFDAELARLRRLVRGATVLRPSSQGA
jgi:DNA-binding PadR family transcriptional regulator